MYEQSLDLETFNTYLSQHNDPNESRFYDDFFTLATSSQDWKATKRLPGLPTPPATPDKNRFNFDPSYQNDAPNLPHQQHSTSSPAAGSA